MIASAVAKISQFDNVEQAKEYAAKKAIKSLGITKQPVLPSLVRMTNLFSGCVSGRHYRTCFARDGNNRRDV